jgi:hypothetical protein
MPLAQVDISSSSAFVSNMATPPHSQLSHTGYFTPLICDSSTSRAVPVRRRPCNTVVWRWTRSVRHLLHQMENPWQAPLPLDLASLGMVSPTVPVADPSQYNRLLSIA